MMNIRELKNRRSVAPSVIRLVERLNEKVRYVRETIKKSTTSLRTERVALETKSKSSPKPPIEESNPDETDLKTEINPLDTYAILKSLDVPVLNTGHAPYLAGYCRDEDTWEAFLDAIEWHGEDRPRYPDAPGHVSTFYKPGAPDTSLVVFNFGDAGELAKTSLVLHEVIHVWQHFLEAMNEKETPSKEIEAYFIQGVYLELMELLNEDDRTSV